jgi:hypothetical protein
MLAINSTWASLDMKIYKACLNFIKIQGTHLGKNLAQLVYKRGKKLKILHKIISITRDNASNNDTCARHLYKILSYIYDKHLNNMPLYS